MTLYLPDSTCMPKQHIKTKLVVTLHFHMFMHGLEIVYFL